MRRALLFVASLLAACGGGGGSGGDPIPSSPVFDHVVSSPGSDSTVVRNTLLDGNAGARPLVTQLWNPDGGASGVSNPHPIGVSYDVGSGFWRIHNLDGADLPEGAAFFVSVLDSDRLDVFLHEADAGNTTGNETRMDHPVFDGDPSANLFLTHWTNPFGTTVVNAAETGVYYFLGTWRVFNQDSSPIPLGAHFIVAFPAPAPSVVRHHATAPTIVPGAPHATEIRHPLLDGDPSARFHVTQNWNPDDDGVYNDHPVGIGFNVFSGFWAIINLDEAPIPIGASFNVWIE